MNAIILQNRFFRRLALQILLMIGILNLCLGEETHLEVMDEINGKKLLDITLEEGEEIFLYWKNSLFDLDVSEKFMIEKGTLILREVSFFNSPESPLPLLDQKDLEDLYQTGGLFSVQEAQKRFTQIDFRIGEIGHPKLKIKGQLLDLKELVGFGGKVRLTIQKLFKGGCLTEEE